jgi:hypothetical protein
MRKSKRTSQHGTQNEKTYDRTNCWTSPYTNNTTWAFLKTTTWRYQMGKVIISRKSKDRHCNVQHLLSIWVIWRVSYKRQELLTLRAHPSSHRFLVGNRVAHLLSFLCCVICFVCLRPVSCVPNVANFSGFGHSFFFVSLTT